MDFITITLLLTMAATLTHSQCTTEYCSDSPVDETIRMDIIMKNLEYLKQKTSAIMGELDNYKQTVSNQAARIAQLESAGYYPRDCSEYLSQGYTENGVYTITLDNNMVTLDKNINVYCDMVTDGGGWIVIQRRLDGTENFERNWNDYQSGFGDLKKEFWLGNDVISYITNQSSQQLRIDLADHDDNTAYALYSSFSLNRYDYYRLFVSGYTGTAGDSFSTNGYKFSTYDEDNDARDGQNCAQIYTGGWWYDNCHGGVLNGRYGDNSYAQGVDWYTWKGFYYSLKFSEMKIRMNPN